MELTTRPSTVTEADLQRWTTARMAGAQGGLGRCQASSGRLEAVGSLRCGPETVVESMSMVDVEVGKERRNRGAARRTRPVRRSTQRSPASYALTHAASSLD